MRLIQRSLHDLTQNRFLSVVTIVTIALCNLIISAFILFFINANDVMNEWKRDTRIIAYISSDTTKAQRHDLEQAIRKIPGVQATVYISKEEALAQFKQQIKRYASLIDKLSANPLPDAYEIWLSSQLKNFEEIEKVALRLKTFDQVEEVVYGKTWLGRFTRILELFRFSGYTLSALFIIATVFIVANTIRLSIYFRREEIRILRLVGAENRFITIPYYFHGLIYGAVGSILALGVLFVTYSYLSLHFEHNVTLIQLNIRFFSFDVILANFLCCMTLGWMGCYISLKQFLKN